jgi:hypothetical protein
MPVIDLALVSQRIMKLAEIAVLDHLESLDRSQAVGVSEWRIADENRDSMERCE